MGVHHEPRRHAILPIAVAEIFHAAPAAAAARQARAPWRPTGTVSGYSLHMPAVGCTGGPATSQWGIWTQRSFSASSTILERDRHNCIRTRNARFAAIRSFMEYVSFEEPSALALTRSVLAIPMKRFEQPIVGFLSRDHMEAILAAPDVSTWVGWRDHLMLATLYNTGARVSELLGMRVADLVFGPTSWIHIHGKGRKERSVPLWNETANELKRWLRHNSGAPDAPLFPGRTGDPLTRVGFTERLKLAALGASRQFPELSKRRIFPHMVRHSLAMHMLQAGVDITVIALWLGHESPVTTHRYVEADLQMKERALKALQAPSRAPQRYRPPDDVLRFLQTL